MKLKNFRKADSLRLSMARHQVGSKFDISMFFFETKNHKNFKKWENKYKRLLQTRLLFRGQTPLPPVIMTIYRGTPTSSLWRFYQKMQQNLFIFTYTEVHQCHHCDSFIKNIISSLQIHPYEAKLPAAWQVGFHIMILLFVHLLTTFLQHWWWKQIETKKGAELSDLTILLI